ncbi:MAG: hypothetical protein RL134_10 [Actinomycetota bacterium]
MTLPPEGLLPAPGERGRVSADLVGTLDATVSAWDDLLAAVAHVDLAAPSRKTGRSAARTLVVLGSWPEGRPLAAIRRDALAGLTTAEHLDAIEGRVVDAHVLDPREDLIESLRRARDDVATWAASPDVAREALLPVAGPLGIVPFGTLVAATAYQCAVAARDLEPAGVVATPQLLVHGLTALIDTVGAVASQQRSDLSLTAITPQVSIGTGARDGDWRTARVEAGEGPTLICDAGLLLDIASGRTAAPAAYARGEFRAQDLPGLLAVAQVLARSPGLPGTDGLRSALVAYESSAAAARAVGDAVGSAWRKLRGR